MKEFSRRDFLRWTAGVATAVVVGAEVACSDTREYVPKNAPSQEDYEREAPLIENPIFRAASVMLHSATGNSGYIGHCGIFREGDNLSIMAQRHQVKERTDFSCLIPGLGSNRFALPTQWQDAYDNDADPNVKLPLIGNIRATLEKAINNGVITPLTFYSEPTFAGKRFAVPMANNGRLSYVSFERDIQSDNKLVFKSESGYACRGFSGTPVLAIDQNKNLTPKSIGLMVTINLSTKDCSSSSYYVKPHLPWVRKSS